MISSISQSLNSNNIKNNKVSFNGEQRKSEAKVPLTVTDKFLRDVEIIANRDEKGTFLSRMLGSPTAIYSSLGSVLAYEIFSIVKLNKLKKLGDKNAINLFKASVKKSFPFVCLAALALMAGLQALFTINSDKKYQALKEDFNNINKNTDAKLSDKLLYSTYIGAMCSSVDGRVVFNKNMMTDPIASRKLKKLIRHELVHAKQYETIARSDDGIKKLNYSVAKSTVKALSNPLAKAEIQAIYNEITSDKTGKYDGVVFHNIAGDFVLKDYITAMNILLTNENATYNDIPIIIDAEHYEKVIKEKGPLTKEEAEKAELYYQAQLNYPTTNFFTTLNPFSKYYDNLLEKEAYKESPCFATRIRKLFGKD